VLLLTNAGDVHRIIACSIAEGKRNVAATKRIAKLKTAGSAQSEVSAPTAGDRIICAAYSMTVDVPETDAERRLRKVQQKRELEQAKQAAIRNSEDDSEDASESESEAVEDDVEEAE